VDNPHAMPQRTRALQVVPLPALVALALAVLVFVVVPTPRPIPTHVACGGIDPAAQAQCLANLPAEQARLDQGFGFYSLLVRVAPSALTAIVVILGARGVRAVRGRRPAPSRDLRSR